MLLVTTLCRWLYDGDSFKMSAAESLCWWLFFFMLMNSQIKESVTNISKLSSTLTVSIICHQHRCGHFNHEKTSTTIKTYKSRVQKINLELANHLSWLKLNLRSFRMDPKSEHDLPILDPIDFTKLPILIPEEPRLMMFIAVYMH